MGLAILWNGDQLSPVNITGLLLCLCGISSHVIHKLRGNGKKPSSRRYVEDSEHQEMGGLIDKFSNVDQSSESDEEKSDSQVIFDILKSRDR